MPSYKTHSIHSELIFDDIDKKIEIEKEDIKAYSIGPDILIASDYKIFEYQHANKVKDYFLFIIEYIKDNKLYENSEVMAFLYGQLDHFILDLVTHPYICSVAFYENMNTRISSHSLIEMWTDDYISKKYDKNDIFYYKKKKIESENLKYLIDNTYMKIFNKKNEHLKYDKGLKIVKFYDSFIRRNLLSIIPEICELINIGDITYNDDLTRIIKLLNLDNKIWHCPELGDMYDESYDELFIKAKNISLQTIKDVNNCIYNNKPLNNYYINFDISYNTGAPCKMGQTKKYIKRMRDMKCTL